MKLSECTKNSMHVKRKDEFHGDYRRDKDALKLFAEGLRISECFILHIYRKYLRATMWEAN